MGVAAGIRTATALLGSALILASGCTSSDRPGIASTTSVPTAESLALLRRVAGEASTLDAIIHGVVHIDGSCASVDLSPPGAEWAVVWPAETSGNSVTGEITTADGMVLRDGDTLTGGGAPERLDDLRALIDPASMTAQAVACAERFGGLVLWLSPVPLTVERA